MSASITTVARNVYKLSSGAYQLQIRRKGVLYCLGSFQTIEDAIKSRDRYCAKHPAIKSTSSAFGGANGERPAKPPGQGQRAFKRAMKRNNGAIPLVPYCECGRQLIPGQNKCHDCRD